MCVLILKYILKATYSKIYALLVSKKTFALAVNIKYIKCTSHKIISNLEKYKFNRKERVWPFADFFPSSDLRPFVCQESRFSRTSSYQNDPVVPMMHASLVLSSFYQNKVLQWCKRITQRNHAKDKLTR